MTGLPSPTRRSWSRILNNVVEQHHRAIKQRCASMLGFKSFSPALACEVGRLGLR
jgi:transposase-like protein